MIIVEVEMTGGLMTEGDETIETEAVQGMTEAEVAQEITETETVETEVITVAKMRTTPEMTGIVENVATLTSHSEQNAIVVGHQRDAAAEAHPNSGLATIEELVIETNHHNLALEIGNVESARK